MEFSEKQFCIRLHRRGKIGAEPQIIIRISLDIEKREEDKTLLMF